MYEIKSVNLRGNQPWILIGRTDAEAGAPVFWSPDANDRFIGKVLNAWKDWGQKEKRASEDEMVGCITNAMDMNLSIVWEMVKDGEAWCAAVRGVAKNRTWLGNWAKIYQNIQLYKCTPIKSEQYGKAKRYSTRRWGPQVGRCLVWSWGRVEGNYW